MNTGSFDNGLAIIYTNEALIVVKVTLEEEKKNSLFFFISNSICLHCLAVIAFS